MGQGPSAVGFNDVMEVAQYLDTADGARVGEALHRGGAVQHEHALWLAHGVLKLPLSQAAEAVQWLTSDVAALSAVRRVSITVDAVPNGQTRAHLAQLARFDKWRLRLSRHHEAAWPVLADTLLWEVKQLASLEVRCSAETASRTEGLAKVMRRHAATIHTLRLDPGLLQDPDVVRVMLTGLARLETLEVGLDDTAFVRFDEAMQEALPGIRHVLPGVRHVHLVASGIDPGDRGLSAFWGWVATRQALTLHIDINDDAGVYVPLTLWGVLPRDRVRVPGQVGLANFRLRVSAALDYDAWEQLAISFAGLPTMVRSECLLSFRSLTGAGAAYKIAKWMAQNTSGNTTLSRGPPHRRRLSMEGRTGGVQAGAIHRRAHGRLAATAAHRI